MDPKILMIENDEDDRFLTQENFQKDWPKAVIEFVSPSELPLYLKESGNKPHLILLSMNARPYTALDLIAQLRGEQGYESTPIIVLSESAQPEEIKACYSAGASSFIKKPASYSNTLFKIKTFIDYWSQTAELPLSI
ncbi:MAG: response regulator [Bacteroidetes bacterium]|nr:response regulator [Bacteroidota bacterium]